MKRYNKIISFVRKTFCLISFLFIAGNFVYSQTTLPKGAKLKTIEYKYANYIAVGYVIKNQFVENQIITFLSKETQDTIISGKYFMQAEKTYIDGIWKRNSENRITRAYGVFEVSNSDSELGLTTNGKKGRSLNIETNDIISYQGFHNNYPAVLEKQKNQTYLLMVNYFDMSGNNRSWFIDKKMIEQYGWFAIEDFIFNTKNITIKFKNGDVFVGETENTKTEDNLVNYKFKEGKFTHTTGDNDSEEMIKLPDNNYKCRVLYSSRKKDNSFKEMEMVVDKSLVDKYGFWAFDDYSYNTPEVKCTYTNGNIFTGKQTTTKDTINHSINSQLTVGKLKYATGEVFEGDLSGNWFCGIPIEGKMKFKDGTIEEGNWFMKYKLTQSEANELEKENSPTVIRKKAIDFFNERSYQNAIKKAKSAMADKNYDLAKKWYLEAKTFVVEVEKVPKDESNDFQKFLRKTNNPTKTEFIDAEIDKIDKEIKDQKWKKDMIVKYGENFGIAIYNGEFVVGMTKKMANEIMAEEIFNKNIYSIGKQTLESWSFNQDNLMLKIAELQRKGEGICDKFGNNSDECRLAAEQMIHSGKTMVRYAERIRLFGGPKIPRRLTFTDGKLTDIIR